MHPAPEALVIGSASLEPLTQRARREEPAVDVAREVILQVLSAGHPPIETVAAVVNTSVRTLQRRLAVSGRTYKKLVDEVRLAAARKALVESAAPLKAIAFELGFAEQASFTRAFRRWTGQAPSEYRKRQRRRNIETQPLATTDFSPDQLRSAIS
jgi:AraC-like DNA-binding protein